MSRFLNFNIVWLAVALGFIALVVIVGAASPPSFWPAPPAKTVKEAVAALDAGRYQDARGILATLASEGNPQAETWLGYMEENGLGASPDMQGAVELFTKAANAGSAEAARRLGQIYLDGSGVLQDLDQARQWLQRGAEGGDAVAQRMLGEIYAKGTGVAKDPAQAYAWLAIAASQGDQLAASERDALVSALAPDTVARAELLAQHTLASIANPKPSGASTQGKLATTATPSTPAFPLQHG